MAKLRLMSNNIWCCGDNDKRWAEKGEDCSAEHRAKGFVKVYAQTLPDVIGLQECTWRLADNLMQLFKDGKEPYALLWGRDTPIIYRTDKLEIVEGDYLIYPLEVPGFEGEFNNAKTKSYCIGVFRTKEDGKLFIFASTHLWWKSSNKDEVRHPEDYQPYSDEAREYQINMLMDRVEELIEKYNCPAIIVGDFNAKYDSLAVQSAFKRGYVHAHDIATDYRDEKNGHHFCYNEGYDHYENPKPFKESIDQFIIKGVKDGFVKRFDRFYEDYYMSLSDHFPMWSDVEL